MVFATVDRLGEFVDRDVTLRGWLYNRRSKGKIHFLQVRDGTGIVQVVLVASGVPEEVFEAGKTLGQESALIVTGQVKADARAPGGFELEQVDGVWTMVGTYAGDYSQIPAFVTAMQDAGFSDELVNQLMHENPWSAYSR